MNYMRTAMLLAFMTALFMAVGYCAGGFSGMMIALFIAVIMNFYAYWNSDKMVLHMYGAREVDARSAPEYYQLVSRLARQAGLPQPRVYIMENPQPNAFATGRSPQNSAVAATTGLLKMLSHDELEGVMAHELAHIRNHDTLTMTITAAIAGAISMLGNWAMFSSHGQNSGNDGQGGSFGAAGAVIAMIVAPFAAMLVQMAISRAREYEADKGGAVICGKPLALASALQKIAGSARCVTNEEAEENPATAHMFVINPLRGQGADNLFSTHPSTANRIHRLQKLAETIGAAGISAKQEQYGATAGSGNAMRGHDTAAQAADKRYRRPKWLIR